MRTNVHPRPPSYCLFVVSLGNTADTKEALIVPPRELIAILTFLQLTRRATPAAARVARLVHNKHSCKADTAAPIPPPVLFTKSAACWALPSSLLYLPTLDATAVTRRALILSAVDASVMIVLAANGGGKPPSSCGSRELMFWAKNERQSPLHVCAGINLLIYNLVIKSSQWPPA